MKERKAFLGHKVFPTSEKTTTLIGKREYMRQYMRAYRGKKIQSLTQHKTEETKSCGN